MATQHPTNTAHTSSWHLFRWLPLIACNIVVLVIIVTCYAAVFVDVDLNPCAMTYMYPNYIKIQDLEFSRLAYKYELYQYKEGPHVRKEILPLRGVPVLFIPGNAGTYKQVRSFGSEMNKLIGGDYSKLMDEKTGHKYANSFDFFAVHFREELSVLEGNVLFDQTEFVNDCIQLILKMYASPENSAPSPSLQVPTSVILLGHSMGGFVARAVLTLPTFAHGSVTTILTLNTPHRIAPVYLHHSTGTLYHHVNAWWVAQFKSAALGERTVLDDIIVVSICGGHRDTLVRSELSSLEGLVPASHGLSMLTTSIPNTWLEADHQSIMWCQQFVHAMLRAMLQSMDPSSHQNTLPRSVRLKHLQQALVSDTPGQLDLTPNKASSTMSTSVKGKGNVDKLRTLATSMTSSDYPNITHSTRDVVIAKFDIRQWAEKQLDHFVLLTSSSRAGFTVFLCNEDYTEFADLSSNYVALPPAHKQSNTPSPASLVYLSPAKLHDYKYLVISSPTQERKTDFLSAQFYNPTASTFTITDVPLFPKRFLLSGNNILNKFVINSHHKHLPLTAHLTPSIPSSADTFLPLTYQFVNQPMIESKFVTNAVSTRVKFHQSTLEPSYILLMTDQNKHYEVSIGLDWKGMVGQYSRAYAGSLIGTLFAVYLFAFSRQLSVWKTSDKFPHFLVALRDHFNRIGVLFVVVLPVVGSFLLGKGTNPGFLFPDPFLDTFLHEHTTPYWVFPFVYISAVAVITIFAILTWCIFILIAFLSKVVSLARSQPRLSASGSFSWIVYPIVATTLFVHSSIPLSLATLSLPLFTSSTSSIFARIKPVSSFPLPPPSTQPSSAPHAPSPAYHSALPLYHHSLFMMFALTVALTVGSMLLWVHNLSGGIRHVLFFDGYEAITVLVLILSVLASRSMLPRKGLPLDVIVFAAGLFCLEYSQLLSYRAMYSMYFVVISVITCHILPLKEKSS